ncbi:beta-galactoside alpha-2:6-sialyltransferase 2-like protein [Dinothrombium tinctorium]|uniref:Beta-galactoside alpha-2,6-sialyltransferase 1 n=1 Tax=Dinothrombium tinctorium TaxID=1965070 RepID=A0A3S3PZS6_9ACAR|nr:beta-galactoside alpha-2:6-sialyltransferase 2-like protein [Dinothrombium tinctorium]
MVINARTMIQSQQKLKNNNNKQLQIDSEMIVFRESSSNSKLKYENELRSRMSSYINHLFAKLRRSEMQSTSVLFNRNQDNRYNVTFTGRKGSRDPSVETLCKINFDSLTNINELNNRLNRCLPKLSLKNFLSLDRLKRTKCAMVTNAASLLHSKKGEEIDSHDVVLRFNDAPTFGYERDVGSKTTLRILNSQVVSNSSFNVSNSKLYQNTILLVWDPSDYAVNLSKWFTSPDHNFFPNYCKAREAAPDLPFYIIHPKVLWKSWDVLQESTLNKIAKNPPSSGFIGLILLLKMCRYVTVYEYLPSIRLTEKCHYYDNSTGLGCTLGDWHPLATEKLYTIGLNRASDYEVFVEGKVEINGCS